MTKEEVKNNIDQDIRLKTSNNSISPTNVGKNMKDIVDLILDPITYPLEYVVNLTQETVVLPIMEEIKNTTNLIFDISYQEEGIFIITPNTPFSSNLKFEILLGSLSTKVGGIPHLEVKNTLNHITVKTFFNGVLSNYVLDNTSIRINIYE